MPLVSGIFIMSIFGIIVVVKDQQTHDHEKPCFTFRFTRLFAAFICSTNANRGNIKSCNR